MNAGPGREAFDDNDDRELAIVAEQMEASSRTSTRHIGFGSNSIDGLQAVQRAINVAHRHEQQVPITKVQFVAGPVLEIGLADNREAIGFGVDVREAFALQITLKRCEL